MKKIYYIVLCLCIAVNINAQSISERDSFYIEKALYHFNNHEYEESIVWFDSLIISTPDQHINYLMKGRAQVNTENYTGGMKNIRRAIQLQPFSAEAYFFMGLTYSVLNKDRMALAYIDTALFLDHEDPDILSVAAGCHYKMGNFHKAAELYREVLKLMPENANAMYFLGLVEKICGEKEEAKKWLEKALILSTETYTILSVLDELGRDEEMLLIADSIILHNPEDWYTFSIIGNYYLEHKKYNEAIMNYEKALGNVVENDYLLNAICYCQIKVGKYQKALDSLEQILNRNPDHYYALANKANALKHLGKYEDAMSQVNRAINAKPNYPYAYKIRADLFFALEKEKDSCTNLKHATDRYYHNLYPNEEILELYNKLCK